MTEEATFSSAGLESAWSTDGETGQEAAASAAAGVAGDRPELVVGAAFAAGLLVALIIKRVAR